MLNADCASFQFVELIPERFNLFEILGEKWRMTLVVTEASLKASEDRRILF